MKASRDERQQFLVGNAARKRERLPAGGSFASSTVRAALSRVFGKVAMHAVGFNRQMAYDELTGFPGQIRKADRG